ncbi:YqgE/AlgH family protein [Planctomycetes bacterium K23_9]|uniref:Uncharacterized protein n=1 Tax=Stieleria marina TaxID=1930275 RepID=A0A517NNN0_9BACT|nr:hypothetical protein K239x_06770 [Planctomycetes bacterium K23_9]
MSDSLIGNLLVASSLVNDPVMSQAVCLVVHQDETQSIGVMLNRPIQPNPQALLNMLSSANKETHSKRFHEDAATEGQTNKLIETDELDQQAEQTLAKATQALGTVHFGGPLNGPVVAVHSSSEFAEAETGRGIYVAAQKPNLEGLVRCQEAPYRLIVGHIGWDNDQLRSEVDAGIWHVATATTDAVFGQDQDMWPRLIRRATARSVANWIGTPDVPMANEVN